MEYYLNFLPMAERLRVLEEVSEAVTFSDKPVPFTPVRVQSGAGIYRQIDRLMAGKPYRLLEGFGCQGWDYGPERENIWGFMLEKYDGAMQDRFDFVFASCPFHEGTRIQYE